jgi:para-nitrobenzyl esterase
MTIAIRIAVAAALISLASAPALAQVARSTPGQPEARTALELMPAKGKLTVTTPAFKDGGQIPFENTQYRTNTFPGLTWSKGPAATRTYAIIMQDNSLLLRGAPILHWTMFNIPASVTRLDPGMAPSGNPAGSAYGPNYLGAAKPYTGPRTPPGPGDDYHFEVFALDTTIPAEAGGDYAAMTKAMDGHILASGEVVGHGIADPNAPPPAPRPAAAQPPKQ